MSRPWTDAELQLLGTQPDADVGRLIGRPGKAVWAKRRALGVADPPSLVRHWTEAEDEVVRSQTLAEAAKLLGRTTGGLQGRPFGFRIGVMRHNCKYAAQRRDPNSSNSSNEKRPIEKRCDPN